MDESKLWELAQVLERTVTRQDSIVKLLDRLQAKLETIEKHDSLQEERMAQMQETIATLVESVQRVDDASHRLCKTTGRGGVLKPPPTTGPADPTASGALPRAPEGDSKPHLNSLHLIDRILSAGAARHPTCARSREIGKASCRERV